MNIRTKFILPETRSQNYMIAADSMDQSVVVFYAVVFECQEKKF